MATRSAQEKRLLQEQAFPDRFSDGRAWIDIAAAAAAEPAVRRFSEAEWLALVGGGPTLIPGHFTAAGAFTVFPRYEAERLRAQFVTLAGADEIMAAKRPFIEALRRARDPAEVGRNTLALLILREAQQKPSQRDTFSSLVKRAGLVPWPVQTRRA